MEILSAVYANAEKTSIVCMTDTAGAVLIGLNDKHACGDWFFALESWMTQNEPSPFTVPLATLQERIETARAQLRDLFASMPAAARAGFYGLNSALKAALDSGDAEAAILIISAVTPPTGLESVKSSAIAILRAI